MKETLQKIVATNVLHAKWLNTLSFMENVGARKISACEDRETVDLMQLKHAAEEHRHAYYLKKQIAKLDEKACANYAVENLLAPIFTYQYLHRLDVRCSRYLKQNFKLNEKALRFVAYLFVTYAIEVRADKLYPVYQEVLDENKSKVMVKSIILEEEGHLEEMISLLKNFDNEWEKYATVIEAIENELFSSWFEAISKEVTNYE